MADDPVGAIKLDAHELGAESYEVVRAWVTNGAKSTVWIDARLLEDPTIFGYLISDTVRHGAKAYSATYGMDESKALEAIVAGLSAELRNQVGDLTVIQEGGLN